MITKLFFLIDLSFLIISLEMFIISFQPWGSLLFIDSTPHSKLVCLETLTFGEIVICLKSFYCIAFTIHSFQKMLKKGKFCHWTEIISRSLSSNLLCTSGILTEDFIHKSTFSTRNWQTFWHDYYHYYGENIHKFQVRAEIFLARHGTRHGTRATCRHACRSARENPIK